MECDQPECPQCYGIEASFCCDVYRFHLGACGRCELVWLEGSDPIFPWRGEDEDAWRCSWGRVKNYRTIDPERPCPPGPTLEEQLAFESLFPTRAAAVPEEERGEEG